MAYPADLLIPANAKYYSFADPENSFNSNYDIIWSFTFKIDNVEANGQYGFSTYLAPTFNILISEDGFDLEDEGGEVLIDEAVVATDYDLIPGHYLGSISQTDYDSLSAGVPFDKHIFKINFDSTGFSAVSGLSGLTGIDPSLATPNSIVIRDYNNNVIFNESIVSLSDTFSLLSDDWQTLRFRYSNIESTIYIEYRDTNKVFVALTQLSLDYSRINIAESRNIYTGITYCSPLSSAELDARATMNLQNYHVEGTSGDVTELTLTPTTLSSNTLSTFTTLLTGVSANAI